MRKKELRDWEQETDRKKSINAKHSSLEILIKSTSL